MKLLKKNWRFPSGRAHVIEIGLLYFLLFAGGLWHVLGVFQSLMKFLAAPLLIALSLWVFWQCARIISLPSSDSELSPQLPDRRRTFANRFYFWSLLVLVASFFMEWLGVNTGRIFGVYAYENTLKPILFGVPIAIGFAWLNMLLTTTAVVQRLAFIRTHHSFLFAIFVAFLMVVFDAVMEPAAVHLKYWSWADQRIPVQNYLAWLILSFIFSFSGARMDFFRIKFPAFVFHAFFAQLGYFGMITLCCH